MVSSNAEIARRDGGVVIVRPSGVRVRWELLDLSSSDGQSLRAVFSASVRPLEGAADRKLLEEAFLGDSAAVSSADVVSHFFPRLNTAASSATSASELPSILSDAGRSSLTTKIADAARAVAFGCGLELLPPFDLELDSPTLRRRQEETRRSAAQAERMSRAAVLLKQFQEVRQTAPDLTPDQIFGRIAGDDPSERAESLRLLLLSAAGSAAASSLWIVAGPHLLRIESPGAESAAAPRWQIFTPPPLLGPFRSVQRAVLRERSVLLIGARSGVLIVDANSPNQAVAFADPTRTSSLGFNGAGISGGKLWATHGEAGLLAWDIDHPDQPAITIRPAGSSPRNLCVLDEKRTIFSGDHRLYEIGSDGAAEELDASAQCAIVAIIPEPSGTILTVHEDGELIRRDRAHLRPIARIRRTGRLTAAAGLPWLSSVRLLVATEQGPLQCVGLDDDVVTQYASNYSGLRLTAAAADRVAAVTPDRQRLVLWSSWDGRGPAAELHVAAIARHRIADLEFA